MSDTYNISIVQGNSASYQLIARDSKNDRINLSGYQAAGKVRNTYSSTGVALTLHPIIYSGVNNAGYSSGIVNLFISGSESAALLAQEYVYDLEINLTGQGITYKFLKGLFSSFYNKNNVDLYLNLKHRKKVVTYS